MTGGNLHWSPINQQGFCELTKSFQLSKGKLGLLFLQFSSLLDSMFLFL